jgi:hypothetical protein
MEGASEIQLIDRVLAIARRVQRTSLNTQRINPDKVNEDIQTLIRGLTHISSETQTLLHELGYSPYNFEHPELIKDKTVLEATTRRVRGVSFESQSTRDQVIERAMNSL